MKRMMTLAAALILAMGAAAQGDNVGMGGPDGNYASLAERIANIEKKTMPSTSTSTMPPRRKLFTTGIHGTVSWLTSS